VRLIRNPDFFRDYRAAFQRIDAITYFAGTIRGTKERLVR